MNNLTSLPTPLSLSLSLSLSLPFFDSDCSCVLHLLREFAKEKDRVESRAAFLLKKTKQRLDLEIDGYMNWICKAGKRTNGKRGGQLTSKRTEIKGKEGADT